MSVKNYGPGSSGYLEPEGRNWEICVYLASKPVLDKELNLSQDLSDAGDQDALRQAMPSGWLAHDPITSSDPTAAIFTPNVVTNTLEIPNDLMAHVNGWVFPVKDSYATGSNTLDLGAGPVGAGARRTDVVVLEAWRRLISASPDVVGKSATGRIWQNGNVATDPANDAVLNFPDDILDTDVAAESTRRVQIQYRLRVIQGIDIFAFAYGLNDPALVAFSVPPDAATPDGNATVFTYTNQSSAGDAGLWRSGDGNPANTLGTVDGYIYAIPMMAVFRRNTTAFDRQNNQNGGVVTPGPSDRPDSLFSDVIVARDLQDMRHAVTPNGWSLPEVLAKNYNYLLDNNLHTEITDTFPNGGGYAGSTVFMADEIGVPTSSGNGTTTGDTTAGSHRGNFDNVRRRFSDRSIYETVTVEIAAPGGVWAGGSTVSLDPTSLKVTGFPVFDWDSFSPNGSTLVDIVDAWWIGSVATKQTEQALPYLSVSGLGANPVGSLTITADTIPQIAGQSGSSALVSAFGAGVSTMTGLTGMTAASVGHYLVVSGANTAGNNGTFLITVHNSATSVNIANVSGVAPDANNGSIVWSEQVMTDESLFVDLLVAYPPGVGLSQTPTADFGTDTFSMNVALGAGSPTFFSAFENQNIIAPQREVQLEYSTSTITISQIADTSAVGQPKTSFKLPERALSVSVVTIDVGPNEPVTLDSTGRVATFNAASTSGGEVLAIQYQALRPLPQEGQQITLYYEARAPQSARSAMIGTDVDVIPKLVSESLTVLTTGSGSQDEGYPFPFAYVQTGGIKKLQALPAYDGEQEMRARADVSVTDFNSSTGFLTLPTFIPMVADPQSLHFTRDLADVDVEGRSFFKEVPVGYLPNAYAQDLSDAKRHKDVLPILAELDEDTIYGFKGQLVLVLLLRYATLDETNAVEFDADQSLNTTVMSCFKLKGNLLSKRAV